MTSKSKIESIKPDQQDFDSVEKEYGPLPPNPSQAALAERYRLVQAAKVIRQLEQIAVATAAKRRIGNLSNNESGAAVAQSVNYVLRCARREARREFVEALEESSWRWSTKK